MLKIRFYNVVAGTLLKVSEIPAETESTSEARNIAFRYHDEFHYDAYQLFREYSRNSVFFEVAYFPQKREPESISISMVPGTQKYLSCKKFETRVILQKGSKTREFPCEILKEPSGIVRASVFVNGGAFPLTMKNEFKKGLNKESAPRLLLDAVFADRGHLANYL